MTTSISERMGPVWSAVNGFVPPSELPTQEILLTIKGEDGKEYVLRKDY